MPVQRTRPIERRHGSRGSRLGQLVRRSVAPIYGTIHKCMGQSSHRKILWAGVITPILMLLKKKKIAANLFNLLSNFRIFCQLQKYLEIFKVKTVKNDKCEHFHILVMSAPLQIKQTDRVLMSYKKPICALKAKRTVNEISAAGHLAV